MNGGRVFLTTEPGGMQLEARGGGGRTLAAARLAFAIGLDTPRYWYHVGCMVLAAPELRLFHRQRTLLLCNDHTGAAELRGLSVDTTADPELGRRAVRHLVRAAVAVLRRAAAAGDVAGTTLIVELPGRRSADGRSPFWEALGRHFYPADPAVAAERVGPDWRSHVAALLPRDPLLVSFLTAEAQDALDRAAPEAAALAAALEAEGLRAGRYVTLDEGGPVYESALDLLADRHPPPALSLDATEVVLPD